MLWDTRRSDSYQASNSVSNIAFYMTFYLLVTLHAHLPTYLSTWLPTKLRITSYSRIKFDHYRASNMLSIVVGWSYAPRGPTEQYWSARISTEHYWSGNYGFWALTTRWDHPSTTLIFFLDLAGAKQSLCRDDTLNTMNRKGEEIARSLVRNEEVGFDHAKKVWLRCERASLASFERCR